MIEDLQLAGSQLRAAWDNYFNTCSRIDPHMHSTREKISRTDIFPPELTHQLDTELEFISSYEAKIRTVKAIMGRARNYSSPLASINSFPTEILTRVFLFVQAQPCNLRRLSSNTRTYYPRNPDYLAQVCTYWREAAISCCSLWYHIDLSPYEPCYAGLLARAERHVARAGQVPIELHIADSINGDRDNTNFYDLVSRISGRMTTLDFSTGSSSSYTYKLLTRILQFGSPNLTKLATHAERSHLSGFIPANSSNAGRDSGGFRLHPMETNFARLTVLHLCGIFPRWSSTAYHGLVDLQLLLKDFSVSIQEEELVTILRASPGLRILPFGPQVINSTPTDQERLPVRLPELQVLKIFPGSPTYTRAYQCPIGNLLRLLAPGAKPIWLSFEGYCKPNEMLTVETEKFFSRSTVTRFYTRPVFPLINLLLCHADDLELVVLDGFHPSSLNPLLKQLDGSASALHLKSLLVTRSTLTDDALQWLVKCCPNGITLHSCQIRCEDGAITSVESLLDRFPTVRTTDRALYPKEAPTAEWDLLVEGF